MTRDLIDCLTEYRGKISPVCTIDGISGILTKIALNSGLPNPHVILRLLKAVGECDEIVLPSNNLSSLDEYYLVWYKDIEKRPGGAEVSGSNNYKLPEFRDELLSGSSVAYGKVNSKGIIDSLKKGLTDCIYLVTIKDTELRKGIILDGTKRIMGLHYLKVKYPEKYSCLNFPRYPIKVCIMESPIARILFPLDFYKLNRANS